MDNTETKRTSNSRKGIHDWTETMGLLILGFLIPNGWADCKQLRTRRSNIAYLTEERIGDTIQAATRHLNTFYNELVKQLERRLIALNTVLKSNEAILQGLQKPWYNSLLPSTRKRTKEINDKILGLRGELAGIHVALLDIANVRPVESALKSIVDREAQAGRSVGPPVAPIERVNPLGTN